MHLACTPVTSLVPTQDMCLILVYQLLRHQWHHKTYTSLLPTILQSGSKDFESGSFPGKTKLLLLRPSPVYANINYNLTVKVGLPEEFCTLRLNCMHLPYFCGALMLKAGASPLSSFAADFPHNAVSITLHQ